MDPLRGIEPWKFPAGANSIQLEAAESAIGFQIDQYYRDFLLYSNGPTIGGDGTATFTSVSEYGANSFTNMIDERLRANRWFPICTDGCGNDFVLFGSSKSPSPVAFVESARDPLRPSYFVASDFCHFLRFFVGNSGKSVPGWPMDKSIFLREDKQLLEAVPDTLLPWNGSD